MVQERHELNNWKISILRWIFALPIGGLAAFLVHLLNVFAFSIAHGFDEVSDLYDAIDMAGMPITGTYIIFFTRAATTGVFLYTTIFLVPKYKKPIAVMLAGVNIILAVGMLVYLAGMMYHVLSIGAWYRLILECVSLCFGAVIGAIVALDSDAE